MSTSPEPIARGLPRIDPGHMHDLDNPYTYYSQLRESSPVHRLGDSPFYLVSSWDLVAEVLGRPDDFSSNLTATMVWHDNGTVSAFPVAELGSHLHVLATADDPIHREHRKMVMPSLVAKRIRELAPFIASTIEDLWERGLRNGGIDWVHAVSERLPMTVVVKLVGLPARDIDELVRWAFAATTIVDGVVTPEQLSAATAAVGELAAYLATAMDTALKDPGDNAIGDLARHVNSGDSDYGTAILVLIQLVTAGAESTISLFGTSVWLLAQHNNVAEQLRADRELVATFVEEALRLESPFRGHLRHVVRDTDLGDVSLPAGSHLYLAWGSANRDPEQFIDPDSVNLDPSMRRSHMAFGKGIHFCVGAALARLEVQIAIDFLLDATSDFSLGSAGPSWSRSLLSRRLVALPLTVRPNKLR